MATHMGAKVTTTMSIENTHLICSAPVGQKYQSAQLWNMHIVNHIWLEDMYSKWMYIREATLRYVHFSGVEDVVNRVPVDHALVCPASVKGSIPGSLLLKHDSLIDKNDENVYAAGSFHLPTNEFEGQHSESILNPVENNAGEITGFKRTASQSDDSTNRKRKKHSIPMQIMCTGFRPLQTVLQVSAIK